MNSSDAPADGAPVLPERLGRYRLEGELGCGGMGRVVRAWDPELERHVALKLLLSDRPEMVARFLREARTQARVQNPNVCQVYEVGEEAGRPYIAMQLVQGHDLLEAMPLMSPGQQIQVFIDVAEAVHAAHRDGLIHRDLKPSNIMVECDDRGRWHPWVMDFGLAREVAGESLTQTNVAMGTPSYMAPEQAMGQPGACDTRTDVYGLGATLYEALTKAPPFDGATGIEILVRVGTEPPTPPREHNPLLARDLETIILTCLAKEPAERYQSARALADDLRCFRDGDPIAAHRPGPAARLLKLIRKHRRLSAAAAAALAVIAGLALFAAATAWQARERAALAQRFGRELSAMENAVRIAHLLPLHDIRPTLGRVREHIGELEVDMRALGSAAYAPGQDAIGQAYLALDDAAAALPHLEAAWQAGQRDSATALALGRALGKLYQEELAAAAQLSDPELRRLRREAAAERYRKPALAALAEVGDEDAGRVQAQAMIALYEQHFDKALEHARRAVDEDPMLHEAWLLMGEVHLARATAHVDEGAHEAALADLNAAEVVLEKAHEIARSDPRVAVAEGLRWTQELELDWHRGRAGDTSYEAGRRAFDRALEADPENGSALAELARLHWRRADQLVDRGLDPLPDLEAAVAAAERAVAVQPDFARAHVQLGAALERQGSRLMRRGLDPGASFARAVEVLDRAATLDPASFAAPNNRGLVRWRWARFKGNQGDDPIPDLKRAAEDFRHACRLAPDAAVAHANLGLVLLTIGMDQGQRGEDPQAALGDAADCFERALEINPHLAVALNSLGAVHWTLAEWQRDQGEDPRPSLEQAVQAFRASARENPNNPRVHNNLGSSAASLGQYELESGGDPTGSLEAALRHLRQALELNPRDATAAINSARCKRLLAIHHAALEHAWEAEIREAHELLDHALEINPTSSDALEERAMVLSFEVTMKPAPEPAARALEAWKRVASLVPRLGEEHAEEIAELERLSTQPGAP